MNCLRCGRETGEDQYFCQDCVLYMESCPVKPGTPVVLPKRSSSGGTRRSAKRRGPTPEEQIRSLKRLVRGLVAALVLLIVMAGALVAFYFIQKEMKPNGFLPGQNYSSSSNPAPPVVIAPDSED